MVSKTFRFLSVLLLLAIVLTACSPASTPLPDAQPVPQTGAVSSSPKATEQPTATTQAIRISSTANSALMIRYRPTRSDYEIFPVDLASGMPLAGYEPIQVGGFYTYAFAPDGKTLVLFGNSVECRQGCIRLIDLVDWNVRATLELKTYGGSESWAMNPVFDSSGQRMALAITEGAKSKVAVVDLSKMTVLALEEVAAFPRRLAFTADGEHLMLIGNVEDDDPQTPRGLNQQTHAMLFDSKNIALLWDQALTDVNDGTFQVPDKPAPENLITFEAAMVASKTNDRIYIAHADGNRLTTVDFVERSAQTSNIRAPQSRIEQMIEAFLSIGVQPVQAKSANMTLRQGVLSQDERYLYLVGEHFQYIPSEDGQGKEIREALGLQIWDVEQNTLVSTIDSPASNIRKTPNGRIILYWWDKNQPWTAFFNPASNEIMEQVQGIQAVPTLRLDGTPVLVSGVTHNDATTTLSVIGPEGYRPKQQWTDRTGNTSWMDIP